MLSLPCSDLHPCGRETRPPGGGAYGYIPASVLFLIGGADHVDIGVSVALLELNDTIDECIERMVTTHAYIQSRTVHRAALAADDVAGFSELTTINLHAESLAFALATVLRATYTFFVCHNRSFLRG